MVKPLVIAGHHFANNVIQGPLAGVSCAPFRVLSTIHGAPAFNYTEMISCKTLIHQPHEAQKRFIIKDPHEGPLAFQLASSDPVELAQAVKIVTQAGADIIDLNCGCPVNKIRRKSAGSKLLSQPQVLAKLIEAMRANTHLPISIKIRVDGGSTERFNPDISNIINESGVDFVTVHGRHWSEHYETPCRYDQIAYFVSALRVPVIGNGDVSDLASLNKLLATGCAGVMIGRAGVGKPWLPSQLNAEFLGLPFNPPAKAAIAQMFLWHVTALAQLLASERFAVLQARKFGKYYARNMGCSTEFYPKFNQCESISEIERLLINELA